MSVKKGVLLLESQPPHIGEVLQVYQQLDRYDSLYICIPLNNMIMPFKLVHAIWSAILKSHATRVQLAAVNGNFAEMSITELPLLFKDHVYLTSDRTVFVHLSSMNIPVELIPEAIGYRGIFLRSAYRQSRALSHLEKGFVNSAKIER